MKYGKRCVVAVAAVGASLASMAANAALDVTTAAAAVTAQGGNIEDVGLAIIGLAAISLGVRWVKATFF